MNRQSITDVDLYKNWQENIIDVEFKEWKNDKRGANMKNKVKKIFLMILLCKGVVF